MNKEKVDKSAAIFARADQIQEKVEMMMLETEQIGKSIEKLFAETPEKEIETLDWQQKEKFYEELDKLIQRLVVSRKELEKLDAEYDRVRQEVNEFYGRTLMKKLDPLPPFLPLEDDTHGEEWKLG